MLTLNALLVGGYTDEALAFSDAVFRATAGQPEQAQIMYGIAGERRHYTQSKVMAWLAFDRAIALSKRFKLQGPLRRWEQVRAPRAAAAHADAGPRRPAPVKLRRP